MMYTAATIRAMADDYIQSLGKMFVELDVDRDTRVAMLKAIRSFVSYVEEISDEYMNASISFDTDEIQDANNE